MSGNDKNDVKQKKVLSFKGGKNKREQSKSKASSTVGGFWEWRFFLSSSLLHHRPYSWAVLGSAIKEPRLRNLRQGRYQLRLQQLFLRSVQHYADQSRAVRAIPPKRFIRSGRAPMIQRWSTAVGQLAKQGNPSQHRCSTGRSLTAVRTTKTEVRCDTSESHYRTEERSNPRSAAASYQW